MKTTTIKQGCMLPGTPHQVYELLMDEKQHASFTGGEASISQKVGGAFSTFDGWASGKNVELVPDQKIVQTWRADDPRQERGPAKGGGWPPGHYSTLTIKLLKAPKGTKLLFTQTDVPSQHAKSIARGWKDYYWNPLRELLGGSQGPKK
ncbi:MAG: SRPBCC domain-containing protein [Candidatus Kerfeldbacteria bacterium]|nr:SRPBCC domain-containing protein [Candidatus Kerfeldbacteria bacterium]